MFYDFLVTEFVDIFLCVDDKAGLFICEAEGIFVRVEAPLGDLICGDWNNFLPPTTTCSYFNC